VTDRPRIYPNSFRWCWRCNTREIVAGSTSRALTDLTLQRLGWRFMEPGGRMLCQACRHATDWRPAFIDCVFDD
jgi:hypothetical protein